MQLISQLRNIRPDVVHIQYPTQGYRDGGLPWLMPHIARMLGIRVVQTWHEGYARDLAKFSLLALAPGRVVVVREGFRRQFGRAFGFLAGLRRLIYIPAAATLPKVRLSTQELTQTRQRYGACDRRLIVFFGFLHPQKQVELLFEIAAPTTDHILVVGDVGDQADYHAAIVRLAESDKWSGHATILGFTEPAEAAAILSAADALVLPLKAGGGAWNSAILAGIQQRTFVLTTSSVKHGYQPDTNVYYARPGDTAELRTALNFYAGTKRTSGTTLDWRLVAQEHLSIYTSLISKRGAAST